MKDQTPHQSKTKLLSAALSVIRAKGYAATTVDDLCHAAGVTKGSFFHHFKSKDELAMSAAAYFGETTEGFFTSAPYHNLKDPLDRLLGYLDFRAEGLRGELPDYTCLLGTLVQETYATHPDIRTACDLGMSRHIAILTRDIEAAKQLYAPDAPWSAASVGYFIQSVLQGAFIFAKAKQSPEVARESLAHLRRYLATIFNQPTRQKTKGNTVNTAESQIRALIETWADAVRRHDLTGILAHHEQDIVMFDLPPPLQSRGIDEYKKTWDLFFRYHQPAQAFDIEELAITAGDDVAFAVAIMRCGSGASAEEGGFVFRLTIGLRKVNGDWRITHEHHSVPSPD
jgi:TetR/AcrR family transcriptional repressor of nem operon